MKFCAKCGNQLFDEAVVCPKCGCAADAPTPKFEIKATNKNQLKSTLLILAGVAVIVIFLILVANQL